MLEKIKQWSKIQLRELDDTLFFVFALVFAYAVLFDPRPHKEKLFSNLGPRKRTYPHYHSD